MKLDELQIKARVRRPWAAVDLGVVFAKRLYWQLFFVWLIPAALLFVLIAPILLDSPSYAILVVWWFKPLLDRLPLHILSRELFGEQTGVGATLRQIPSLWRPQWFSTLTIRRFSPTRSMDQAVVSLEGLKGDRRRRRIDVLHGVAGSASTWLTIICVHVESFVLMALLTGLYLFIPSEYWQQVSGVLLDWPDWLHWMIFLSMLLCYALIAPFYNSAGFMLYISRRIELEAWDVELQFRSMASKFATHFDRSERQRAAT